MRLILTLCLSLCCFIPSVAQTIWNSNTVTFNKVALEDADPITQHVILTRGENKGIYNSASETVCTSISPMDTEWAEGTTADWSNLVFESFSNGVGLGNNGFRAPENTPLVLHLITDDIYIDITFTSWGSNGSFTYERASSAEGNNSKSLLNIGPNGRVNIFDNSAIHLDGLTMNAGISTSLVGALNISKISESLSEGDNSSIPKYYEATQGISNFPGSVSISYTDEEVLGFEEALLVIEAQNNAGEWVVLDGSMVDEDNNSVASRNGDLSFKRITLSSSDASLSIETISGSNAISVYPNPTMESITVNGFSNNIQAQIININGRVVMKSTSPKMNMSSLSKGMYILNVKDANHKTGSFKIIKK